MVAYLSKSNASAGFAQIMDFLNTHVIQYALVVNPSIYVSCVKQFWASATIKKVNDVVKLRSPVDGKKHITLIEDGMAMTAIIQERVVEAHNELLGSVLTPTFSNELALLCKRMFPEVFDKIEKYVGGLPNMIHRSVIVSKPKTMQDAIEFATELMDKKFYTFVERQTENKKKQDDKQQQQNKRQNTSKAYTVRPKEKKPYGGSKLLCSKCNYHHDASCAYKCHKCNRVGHLAHDYRSLAATNNQRNLTCYECGNQGHYMRIRSVKVLEVVTAGKLMTEVVTTAAQVPKPSAPRKRRNLVIQDPKEITTALVIMHLEVRKNMMIYLKNMAGFKMDFFKGMTYSEIRPIFERHYNLIKAFLKKGEEEVIVEEEGSKRKVNDDDVFTEATPLALKRNFDREDMETLWKLVKERSEAIKPKNFLDDFLLNTLKIIFEKPNVEVNVWRDQKGIYGLAKNCPIFFYEEDEEYTIQYKEYLEKYPDAVTTILPNEEPEYSSSMGYEHSNTTPETESDEIIKSGVEELVPILSENKVTSEDKKKCDMPVSPICDDHSDIFSDSKNDDDISSDDDDFEDIEYVEVLLPDPEIVSLAEENGVEEENVVYQEEEEVDLEDIFQIQDIVLREKLLSITRLISNIESLNDNPTPDRVLNSSISIPIFEEFDNSLSDNFPPEFETFCNHTEETRSGNTTHVDDSFPEYDSFCFKIEPDQERILQITREGTPVFEALLIDDSIPFPNNKSPDSDFDNPSFPRPPPEPPDADFELDFGNEISVVMNKFECLRDKFDDSFMFAKVFSFLLSAESEDTILDPGISV
uniref:Reverse transcriptase domain-containing protein n=1 Tax=Tanacetum cinerariifolium TaxID=118510 RepID=A0A699GUH3_TANCI|nr:hypothetical protein [Tanacetum cinerariifolium]